MKRVRISHSSGALVFTIDPDASGPAIFVFGVRRSGSTMLNKICQRLATLNATNFVDIVGLLFDRNIETSDLFYDDQLQSLLMPGNLYGGFRNFPSTLAGNVQFRDGIKILLVRDPRDALVSDYFSAVYSHPIPLNADCGPGVAQRLMQERKQSALRTLDEHVLVEAKTFRNILLDYASMFISPNSLILRYEQVVFRKQAMIELITSHFGWSISKRDEHSICAELDIRPTREDPTAFIRNVSPGDYRRKLSRGTIAKLNDELRDVLELYQFE